MSVAQLLSMISINSCVISMHQRSFHLSSNHFASLIAASCSNTSTFSSPCFDKPESVRLLLPTNPSTRFLSLRKHKYNFAWSVCRKCNFTTTFLSFNCWLNLRNAFSSASVGVPMVNCSLNCCASFFFKSGTSPCCMSISSGRFEKCSRIMSNGILCIPTNSRQIR